jgi:16S rRNA (adenine1518-N6/adenine1519-N6)-dimethyltransferase
MNQQEIKNLLSSYHLSPQKRFGQNFLIDDSVVAKVIDSAELTKTDTVLEIGPGLGTLTTVIAPRVKKLIAVEFDRVMVKILENNESLKQNNRVTLVNADILDFDPTRNQLQSANYKVIGAIPYQISSPLLHKIFSWPVQPTSATLIIQKEVAEKICAAPPHGSYLSIVTAAFGRAEILKFIQPSSFYPAPKVHSAIIKIVFNQNPHQLEPKTFSRFLHRGFKNPRKMINKAFDKNILQKTGIDPQLRPENLTLENWISLYHQEHTDR